MPKPPLPENVVEFLRAPNPAVIASVRPNGEPHTATTWYEIQDDGSILVNMDGTRARLKYLRANPHVSLSVMGAENWYSQISLSGRVSEIRRDPDLADIDRLATRYRGAIYPDRERESWTAIIEVTSWFGWGPVLSA
ncbi:MULTISPECIES: pyridoxamine 5'-phosphate oxidase family protein [unclassified Rathayibacter]|uniref:pyridoxamine 5'-phosphate oxidase family protein n=1 Tax=unclassified Rathayibacter TaxID=2609250 RepID=UPI001050EA73|nr:MULTISPECIES: pyridoxamine 5'-phosphate oxidase family protein [unclassified Rathayibacter]TCL79453.1 PPOX class probable F420-dependent enzyme [Rathayibacter sp. PhB192]TCM25278.1 PPOX class probable F420-dependent enzyme [Rathayibacter sp. PhB179]